MCANRNCKHHFHCECISRWTQSTCPVCRRPLDLFKYPGIDDYRETAGFTMFGNNIDADIKYLMSL